MGAMEINNMKPSSGRISAALALAAALLAVSAMAPEAASAQPRVPATSTLPQAGVGAPAAKSSHESVGRMSKFEARRVRHRCRDRANDRGLKGPDRDAFISKCYFGRVLHRGLRHDCAKEGEAKGLDKAALRDFTRDCVKERQRPKD